MQKSTSSIIFVIKFYIFMTIHHQTINPQMPKVFRQPKTPKGGGYHPPGFLPSRPNFFEIFLMGMCLGSRNPTVIIKKILSLLHDLENQGQTPFCMTFLISGCKHDTNSILVSILTFSRSRITKMWEKYHVTSTVDLKTQGHTHSLYDLS